MKDFVVIALTAWTQACTAYRPAPANVPLSMGRPVRVRAAVPFALRQPTIEDSLVTVCHATEVKGNVLRMRGDTLVITHARDFIAAPAPDGSQSRCPEGQMLGITLSLDTEVTEQRVDRGRTTVLILAIVAAVIGFAAFAASNIDPGLPSGGGSF